MIIALDAMGGDFAPQCAVDGALLALESLPENVKIRLIGVEAQVMPLLNAQGYSGNRIEFHHASEVIEMGEHPTKALQQKQDSSIAVGFRQLATAEVQAFCSAGNTGAMLVGAVFSVKPISGIMRPVIAGYVPKSDGSIGVLLDVGANVDCKPEVLAQFGELGSVFAKSVLGIDNPKVGLMNVGEEETKGTVTIQTAYQLLKANSKIDFVGNIEGRDVFNSKVDVIVCDGVVGNVIFKLAESLYEIMVSRKLQTDSFFDELNYESTGGNPIIGINGSVVIGHGISSAKAISNMVLQSWQIVESDVCQKIKAAFQEQTV